MPQDWTQRLPPWAHHALSTRYVKFQGGELHEAVLDLMINFEENYGLVFPKIPVGPLLLAWVKDMALPRK